MQQPSTFCLLCLRSYHWTGLLSSQRLLIILFSSLPYLFWHEDAHCCNVVTANFLVSRKISEIKEVLEQNTSLMCCPLSSNRRINNFFDTGHSNAFMTMSMKSPKKMFKINFCPHSDIYRRFDFTSVNGYLCGSGLFMQQKHNPNVKFRGLFKYRRSVLVIIKYDFLLYLFMLI